MNHTKACGDCKYIPQYICDRTDKEHPKCKVCDIGQKGCDPDEEKACG